ncbi:MAG: TolC family protein [Desulfobacteraceae bacterium]|nr:TolC family protein [Desulfobacteraceae bacterium]
MISKAERLHAQVAAEEADREHKKSVRDMEIASTALCGLIFCEPSAITPVSPLFWTHELPEKEAFLENAHKDNIILKNLKQQMKLADAGLQNEKSAYRPDVYLFASKALLTNDLTILDPEWAAGIGARFTLFDGFARSGKVASARAVKTQVNQLYTQMLRDVDTLVVSRYQTLIQSLEQIDALDVSISFAREHLRARTRGFEEGMATSLDVVDAELAFSKVKIDRLEALYSFDLALSKLLEASGDISSFNKYRIKGEKETNHL